MIKERATEMAEEQNQENTVINQGTTIDQLPGLDGMSAAQKQAFIDSAFVPIRGAVDGEQTTVKVTGRDLAASGENRIDSISVNGSNVPPDANKNVNIAVQNLSAGEGIDITDGKINANYDEKTLTVNYDTNKFSVRVDNMAGDGLAYNGSDGSEELYIPYSDSIMMGSDRCIAVRTYKNYDSEDASGLEISPYNPTTKTGGMYVNCDATTIKINDYNELEVINPLPEGNSTSFNQLLGVYKDGTPEWLDLGNGLRRGYNPSTKEFDNTINVFIADTLDIDGSGALEVKVPVPEPDTDGDDRGKVLTVDDFDEVVWSTPALTIPDVQTLVGATTGDNHATELKVTPEFTASITQDGNELVTSISDVAVRWKWQFGSGASGYFN